MKTLKQILIIIVAGIGLVLASNFLMAQEVSPIQSNEQVEIYFFYSSSCPYCAQARVLLADLKKNNKWLVVKEYEVSQNTANSELFEQFLLAYNQDLSTSGVPAFFISKSLMMGFDEGVETWLEHKLNICKLEGCVNPLSIVQANHINDKIDKDINNKYIWGVGLGVVVLAAVGLGVYWVAMKKS